MVIIKKGNIGPAVKKIQLQLNTRLKPSPKLNIDGSFGPKTMAAVIRFQRQSFLAADGIVGPNTRAALAARPANPPPPNLAKFISELGELNDFVQHIVVLEATHHSTSAVMNGLGNFFKTAGAKRYLLVQGDKVGVIDFRHFFAAATEAYNSGQSGPKGFSLGGSPGQSVLLGVGNEMAQCFEEALARKLNSCFAAEDLGSNRLGAAFGELVKIRESGATNQKVSQLLREYVTKYRPVTSDKVSSIKTSGRWDLALEVLAAIVAGIGDILVPRAY